MILIAIVAFLLFHRSAQNNISSQKNQDENASIDAECYTESAGRCSVKMYGLEMCSDLERVLRRSFGDMNVKSVDNVCIFNITFTSNSSTFTTFFRKLCNKINRITTNCKPDRSFCTFSIYGKCHLITNERMTTTEDQSKSSSESSTEDFEENELRTDQLLPLIRRSVCLEEWNVEQKWCTTPVGRTVFPCQNPCMDQAGDFITRRCLLIRGIPRWSNVRGECFNTTFPSSTTFFNTVRNEITPTALSDVSNIIGNNSSLLTVLDVDIIGDILNGTVYQPKKVKFKQPFFGIVNNVLGVNKTIIRNTREFGSTDKILKSVDSFLIDLSQETPTSSLSLSNIAFEIVQPSISQSHDHYNLTLQEVSAKIPNDILNTSILTVFKNSNLFPEGNVTSEVVDLKVLGVNGILEHPVSIYLHANPLVEVICSFWKYNENDIGNWSTDGVQTVRIADDLIECISNHLTAFALLGISDRIIDNLSEANQLALQIISGILCALSLIGLIIIFVTCFALKKWYKRRISTIQLSCVICVEIFMLFLNDILTIDNDLGCVFFGILMHYFVLVKFMLMLIIAKMQYENFVVVLTSRNKSRRVLLHAMVSFSVPILIVGVSAGAFPQHYNSGNVDFCYPKEEAFKYFVIMPIATIVLANTIIFSMVMFKISHSISRDSKQKVLQAKLAIMLFFMLGLTWIFSVFSHMVYTQWLQLTFVYIFCILSPLQGLVIFLFTIVMDTEAKAFWIKCCNKLRYKPLERESSNNTTSTAVLMSNVSQSAETTSEETRLKARKCSEDT